MPDFGPTRREFAQAALAFSLPAGVHAPSKPDTLVAFRVSHYHWIDDRRFEALLAFFEKHPGTADELAFFTAGTHPPRPLDEMLQRAELLAKRIAAVRRRGMEAGINVLATIGHLDENLDTSLNEPWQRMVDPSGREPRGSYCPAGKEFLAYVDRMYAAMAEASPAFIWVDDDVRIAHHPPIRFACFCDVCMRNFSAETGRSFTRETLVRAFASGSVAERLDLRRRWLEHNRTTIDNLLAAIEKAVHRVKPDISLGHMTGPMLHERAGFADWAKTLAGPGGAPVRWRPGAGFYSEERLVELSEKAHALGRQVASLPAEVRVIQSEIENFPYDLLRKSAYTTAVEAATHMAAGTTATAFNVLSQRPDPLEEFESLLGRIRNTKPFYEILRRELGRSMVTGIWPAWNGDLMAANSIGGAWPEGPQDALAAQSRPYALSEIGVPVCYAREGAVAVALAGSSVLAFSKDELRKMLAGGVLMDAAALEALESLGLGELAGVRPGSRFDKDAIEQLTSHRVNGRFAGWSRDCRQSFWREPAVALEPRAAGVEALARIIDYQDRELGNSVTAFENPLGGRVVVTSYFPWSQMHNLAKASQMKAICDWISRGRLPVFVESFARVHAWVRKPDEDRLACYLLNGSLEPLEGLTLRLPGRYAGLEWVGFDASRRALRPIGAAAESTRVTTPPVAAWTPGLLLATASRRTA